jgi:hypothetical protein
MEEFRQIILLILVSMLIVAFSDIVLLHGVFR